MIERAREALAAREAPMLELIRELVEINSFTDAPEGGNEVGRILARELESIPGVSVRTVPSTRFASHLVATTTAASASASGWLPSSVTWTPCSRRASSRASGRDGAIARGPGVLDMKGGLCVAIEAMRALAAVGALDGIAVRLVIVSDEETGSPEGRPLIQREVAGAAAALVFEAGRKGDAVITARKGTGAVTATATGRAAHAGNAHQQGVNAIWALARFVDRAQGLTDYDRGVTVNVGKVSGGQGKNTVPDRAEALVDFRFVRIEDGDAVRAALEEAGRAAAAGVSGAEVAVEGGVARSPLERTDASVALYREYAACAEAAGLGTGESPLLGGGSDASSTAAIGIPSIDGLGPRGTGFHTKEELIEVATLIPKAEALARFLVGRIVRG